MASEQFSLCWDNFHKNMSSGMNALLEHEDLVDVTLAIEGRLLKAHKMVLSVCSPYFKELFKSNPCQHPIVFMKDVSYVAMSDLLQFMYQGEVQVSQDNLTTFIKTAEALQIKGLTGDGNGSTDADTETVPEKPAPRHVEESYKPMPRPKKQPLTPATTSSPTPSTKRPRLSSNDSQSTLTPITKTEPALTSSTNADSSAVQFKVEPYDQNQSALTDDDGGENMDDMLDDSTVDGAEDYSMMEGEEPQAGTSTDGTGEGQGRHPQSAPSLATVIGNQRRMMQRQDTFQRSLDHLTSLLGNFLNRPPLHSDGSLLGPPAPLSDLAPLEPIDSLEKLTELEEKLKNDLYMAEVVESMSVICGKSGTALGLDCCYKLIDYFLTRRFVAQCSWTGNTRLGAGVGKVPLKFFEHFRKCFRSIVLLADVRFTETECEVFFKRIMRNSVKRINGSQLRQSKHKNRPKKLKYNTVKRWRQREVKIDLDSDEGMAPALDNKLE